MKHLILILCIAGLSCAVVAQDIAQDQVPSLVVNAFTAKFSNVSDVEWEVKGDLFKVEFEIGKRDHDLWIDKNGNIKKHKEDFPKNDLPAAIKQKLESDFKGYTIDDVDRIETDGKVLFEVDLDSSSGDRKVLFASDGSIQQGTN